MLDVSIPSMCASNADDSQLMGSDEERNVCTANACDNNRNNPNYFETVTAKPRDFAKFLGYFRIATFGGENMILSSPWLELCTKF